MIQKVIFYLRAVKGGYMNGTGGTELHASFLHGVQQYDRVLAMGLHEDREKPFALGPLVGEMKMQEGKWLIETEKLYSFSLASLDQSTYKVLPKLVEFWSEEPMRIGQALFTLSEAKFVVPEGITYQSIIEKARETSKCTLSFLSPTVFRSKGRYVLFPEFDYVYRSLLETWNTFSNQTLQECSLEGLRLISYNLKTVMERYDRYQVPGFIGNCRYLISNNQELAWTMGVLGYYAGFAGVGYKRTMGQGQVRFRSS